MNAPQIGALRHRVVLEAAVETPDGAGGAQTSWQDVATLAARIDTRGRTERVEAGRPVALMTHRITLRRHREIVPGRRFRLGCRTLRILAVEDADAAGRYLRCEAEEEQ